MLSNPARWIASLALMLLCGPGAAGAGDAAFAGKLAFDLSSLDAAGLYGPADGLRALHYEFCIPDRRYAIARVRAIDASVEMHRSPGRIGCRADQLLCLGSTHQHGYREVLEGLARLDFVERIEQSHFE